MADCLPFNAIKIDEKYDRVYKAEDWAWYFATFLANGVFPKPSDGLQVTAYDKMEIKVNAGYAFINGYAFRNPARQSVTLSTAEGALNRIDRVVIRWDLTRRDIYLTVLKGAPSARPAAAALTRNTEIWELALADVFIAKGVTRIQAKDITDQRFNSALCGIVKGTVEEIDASVLTKQFNDFFRTYSEEILDQYGIYIQNMERYITELEAAGDSKYRELAERGEGRYLEFDTTITAYIEQLRNRGDSNLAELLQGFLDFREQGEGDFLEWFKRIQETLAAAENGKLLEHIEYLLTVMYDVGTAGDVDRIIGGTYVDDSEAGFFETGTEQDVDEIISGTFVEDEPEETTQERIQAIVDRSFGEVRENDGNGTD